MGRSVFNVVKGPIGWSVFCDRVRLGGVYGTKEAALEAATVAASITLRDGYGIQINVPAVAEPNEVEDAMEAWPSRWNDLRK